MANGTEAAESANPNKNTLLLPCESGLVITRCKYTKKNKQYQATTNFLAKYY